MHKTKGPKADIRNGSPVAEREFFACFQSEFSVCPAKKETSKEIEELKKYRKGSNEENPSIMNKLESNGIGKGLIKKEKLNNKRIK